MTFDILQILIAPKRFYSYWIHWNLN